MGFCINPASKRLSNTRPNGGTNHGSHRTSDAGTDSRTGLSPSPATSSRASPCRRRRATLCGYSRQSISSAITLILGSVPRLPLSLLRTTPTPLLMPLRIHPPRQPHRNQPQHRNYQRRKENYADERSDKATIFKPELLSQQQQPSKHQKDPYRRLNHRNGITPQTEDTRQPFASKIPPITIGEHRKPPSSNRKST